MQPRAASAVYVGARINDLPCRCLLDSGADASLIPKSYVHNPDSTSGSEKLRTANGTEIAIVECITLAYLSL